MAGRESKTGLRVEDLKASELYGVVGRAAGETADLGDPAILQKLFAAEDFYERDLQITFKTTKVYSAPESRATAPAPLGLTTFDPTVDISEPAYDLELGAWSQQQWGMIKLRRRPVRSIQRYVFAWVPQTLIWEVPIEWIVFDGPAGTTQLKPVTGQLSVLTFGAFVNSVFMAGRGLPHSLYIDYTTGSTPGELEAWDQDLLEGVRLRTLLLLMGTLSTARTGGQTGGSLGLDGMSESRSFGGKYGAYSAAIQLAMEREAEIRGAYKAKNRGIPVAFA